MSLSPRRYWIAVFIGTFLSACGGGGGGGGGNFSTPIETSSSAPASSSSSISSASVSSTSSSISSSLPSSSSSASSVASSSTSASSLSSSANSFAVSLQATTDTNGKLDVSWSRTAPATGLQFSNCEFHINLDMQRPRVPFKTITNCASSGNFSLTDLPFFGGTITLLTHYNDGTGDKTLTTTAAISESPANFSGAIIRAVDWGQAVMKTNPKLVPDRDAFIRVHVTSSSVVLVPDVKLTVSLNGDSTTISMAAPAFIPNSRHYDSLNFAYRAIITKFWMKPGLKVSIDLNGQVRTLTPTFASPNILYLTLVPTTVMGQTAQVIDDAQVKKDIQTNWPLADVQLRTRAGFTSAVTEISKLGDLLDELRDLRTLDQDPSHYYGFFSGKLQDPPFGGLGDKPGTAAIGLDYDNANLMPHELGHNFNLGHIDCGHPDGVDTAYPYSPDSLGSLGINLAFDKLLQPDEYVDLMSYCSPKHVSDYSFETVQDYLSANPPQAFKPLASALPINAAPVRSLFISGQISVDGKVNLRRLVPMNRAPVTNAVSDYELRLVDTNGAAANYFVELPAVDHPEVKASQYFSAIVPYTELTSLSLMHKGKAIYTTANTAAAPAKNSTVQQKSEVVPTIIESAKQACLSWNAQDGTSATLIHQADEVTTMTMDDKSGNLCVSTEALASHGNWQIVLRKGLSVREFNQLR